MPMLAHAEPLSELHLKLQHPEQVKYLHQSTFPLLLEDRLQLALIEHQCLHLPQHPSTVNNVRTIVAGRRI